MKEFTLQTIDQLENRLSEIKAHFGEYIGKAFEDAIKTDFAYGKSSLPLAEKVTEELITMSYAAQKASKDIELDKELRSKASFLSDRIYPVMRQAYVMRDTYVNDAFEGDYKKYRGSLKQNDLEEFTKEFNKEYENFLSENDKDETLPLPKNYDDTLENIEINDIPKDIPIDEEHFPDENFRGFVNKEYGTNGVLTVDTIANTAEMDLTAYKIKDLTGIEYFTALKKLNCCGNDLIALDLSKNTALEWLDCAYNNLTVLNVSGCTELKTLACGNNDLAELNVSKNTALEKLYCPDNNLYTFNINNNTALKHLCCNNNHLTELDTSKNAALEILECVYNRIFALDVSNNKALKDFHCDDNYLTVLDVSKNTLLKELRCSINHITNLDVSNNTELVHLCCSGNRLTALDVSKNTALEELICGNNRDLTALDISKNTALRELYCAKNNLTALDVSNNKALKELSCSGNSLTTLDISNNTELRGLYCDDFVDVIQHSEKTEDKRTEEIEEEIER